METYNFTLVFELPAGELTDETLEAFYAAGADDALVGQSAGVFYVDFSREAEDILDAVASAIQTIETSGVDAVVKRVEPDDFVTIADIARRMARTNESIRLLTKGERGPGDFPAAATRVGAGRSRLWRWADVVEWFRAYENDPERSPAIRYWSVIALTNDFLRTRTYLSRSDSTAAEVRETLGGCLTTGALPPVAARRKAS